MAFTIEEQKLARAIEVLAHKTKKSYDEVVVEATIILAAASAVANTSDNIDDCIKCAEKMASILREKGYVE